MNIKVNTIGGGIFSKFMVAIQSINDICSVESIENIYIDIDRIKDNNFKNKLNPFDFVFEQNDGLNFDKVIDAYSNHVYRGNKFGNQTYTDIFNSPDLNNLKSICNKIKIKDTILNKVTDINESTLGIHVRLTDMNVEHPIYGIHTTDDYIKKTIDILNNNKTLNKIFISSDNEMSIEVIKKNEQLNKYEIITNKVGNRHIDEKGVGYYSYQVTRMTSENFWIDSFIDMISLSKCSELLYRVSNLNNSSVIFSNTIKKTHRL